MGGGDGVVLGGDDGGVMGGGGGDVAVLCIWGVGSRSQRTSLQAGVVVEAFSSVQVIS